MLLTSKDIPQKVALKFSNSNCELLISELPTIDTTAIVFYRPSGTNFSLPKYNEALKNIKEYLVNNEKAENPKKILLMGDFNFTSNVVIWEKSEEGHLNPNYAEGVTPEKEAFKNLLEVIDDHALQQIVDKPTREANNLDLIFTTHSQHFLSVQRRL